MRYVTEYRDGARAQALLRAIAATVTRPWKLMEVCGGQTHSIVKFGIDQLLPETLSLLHGPGCPVCVTPVEFIDAAIALASAGCTVCTYGDMLRVPGTQSHLLEQKANGADVRMVYSPLDVVRIAEDMPDRQVVFFAVGFETTAPATAALVRLAQTRKVPNLTFLTAHVLVPAAMRALLSDPAASVDGFLAAGHVCTIMGLEEYEPIAREFEVPIVVTGFEPVDLLQGILECVRNLERGTAHVENQYPRAVRSGGNQSAKDALRGVFEVVPRNWRGLGMIPSSGLDLHPKLQDWDARRRFSLDLESRADASRLPLARAEHECISGQVLSGQQRPNQCPAFGTRCTPEHPLGAPMVSSEGACAAYYRYRANAGAIAR